jgi:hypothetical protein
MVTRIRSTAMEFAQRTKLLTVRLKLCCKVIQQTTTKNNEEFGSSVLMALGKGKAEI